jgi:hypothetical protein
MVTPVTIIRLHRHLVVIDHTVEFDFGLSLLVGGI